MSNLESIHNHVELVKRLGTSFSSIQSNLKGWDDAWKSFYLVTPFSTCVQIHEILTLFDLCLETWRDVRSDGEGLAASFADWEGHSDWGSESQRMWMKSVLFQLRGLIDATDSQLSFARKLSSLQTELLRNCHDHLRPINVASYLWFWRRLALLSKRREFDSFSENLSQHFLVIKSCSEGLVDFWKGVETELQNLLAGTLRLQRSLILVLTPSWMDCSDVYAEVVPDSLLNTRAMKLSVDFLQPATQFRYQSSSHHTLLASHEGRNRDGQVQVEDPPRPPGPLPSGAALHAMTLSSILFRCNQDLKFLVRSFKWVNAIIESRWIVSPQEVRLLQEDLRFALLLRLYDYEAFLQNFLTVFENLLLRENLTEGPARESISKLHYSFARTSTVLHSTAAFVRAASGLLAHSITCQLERTESSAVGLAAIVDWIKLKWYQLWLLQPTGYSAYFNDRVLPVSFATTGLPQDELAKETMEKWSTDLRQNQDRLWSLTYALDMYVNQTVYEMALCAKAEDAGSSHIRSIFQKDVEELKIAGEELSAFRKDFENDADFLKGEYNSAATVNWSRTRPAVRRLRRW
ncbi:hypothetical protein BT69DRAFT_106219 [Atractiella rhizophila]|nr:hypothetical protein BT69DRAFT_106219 [Atractiella rhizophila]